MSTRGLKKWALLLTFWIALHTSALRAQTLPLGPYTGTSPISFGVDANGLLSAVGTEGGTGSLSLSGSGTRMFWYPQKAAFRAGTVSGTQWDSANLGHYSVAFGRNTMASGDYATASGYGAIASGTSSTAMGSSQATNEYSTAFGTGRATGQFSTALGYQTTASGYASTASGYLSQATNGRSTAFGSGTASGYLSTAFGYGTASGYLSTAFGYVTTASGITSTAFGHGTTASAYADFVIGRFNSGTGTTSSWVSTEPLFEIGNGTQSLTYPYPITPSDAVVVYKNGNMTVQGAITAPAFITTGTTVTGTDAVAFGYGTSATGNYSTASGFYTTAPTYADFVVGRYNAGGGATGSWNPSDPLFEVGNGTSSTSKSDALLLDKSGNLTVNSVKANIFVSNGSSVGVGPSVAFGQATTASGTDSTTSGAFNTASGLVSTAFGAHTTASGYFTTASGRYTTATAFDELVAGTYNVGGGTTSSWVSTDPLFEIGNGTSGTHNDAVIVNKDGSATLQGPVTITTPGGDIPMYSGS